MNNLVLKSQYDAETLASMAIPGLPKTRAAIFKRAKTENWGYVEVQGKGGRGGIRREYILPVDVMNSIREAAVQNVVSAAVAPVKIKVGPENQMQLIETESQTLKADARKGVLLALETMMNRSGYPMKKAARTLVEMARAGEASPQLVAMLKMARDQRGRASADGLPSERSVLRFVEYDRSRGGQLAPKKRERDMTVPDWAPTFLGYYQKPEKPTVEHAYRVFASEWAAAHVGNVPSVWQVRRFLGKVGNVTLEMGRMGDRELKSLKPFIRRSFDTLLPGDIYSGDGHTFDAEVQHPLHGRPFRPEITSIVDIATRKVVGWSIGLAESALAVLDALRTSVLQAGIPAILYVDNGSGYKNEMMNDVATGFMSRLGIEMINSLPYNSQARGVIERLHQTIWVTAAKQVPGYIGRDMDRQAKQNVFKLSRQALAKPKSGETVAMPLMGWPGFVDFCKQKVAEYNDRPHRSLPKITDPESGRRRHMTPNESWALAESKGFQAHTVADDVARPLFRPQVLRTVRRGEIELFGNRYFGRALEEFHTEQLRIGYDVVDPAKVWVYDEDGRFICTAELNGNQREYMPMSVIERARDKRAAGREKRLEVKLEEVREERRGAPALEQSDGVRIPGFMTMTREQMAARARDAVFVDVVATPVTHHMADPVPDLVSDVPGWTAPKTPQARWDEWNRLNLLGEDHYDNDKQKTWRQSYPESAEFRAYKRKTA